MRPNGSCHAECAAVLVGTFGLLMHAIYPPLPLAAYDGSHSKVLDAGILLIGSG